MWEKKSGRQSKRSGGQVLEKYSVNLGRSDAKLG